MSDEDAKPTVAAASVIDNTDVEGRNKEAGVNEGKTKSAEEQTTTVADVNGSKGEEKSPGVLNDGSEQSTTAEKETVSERRGDVENASTESEKGSDDTEEDIAEANAELEEQKVDAEKAEANKKNPAFIPRKGKFYEHDDRLDTDEEAELNEDKSKEKNQRGKKAGVEADRWKHDRFNPDQQTPKSCKDIIRSYGYDIRKDRSNTQPKGNNISANKNETVQKKASNPNSDNPKIDDYVDPKNANQQQANKPSKSTNTNNRNTQNNKNNALYDDYMLEGRSKSAKDNYRHNANGNQNQQQANVYKNPNNIHQNNNNNNNRKDNYSNNRSRPKSYHDEDEYEQYKDYNDNTRYNNDNQQQRQKPPQQQQRYNNNTQNKYNDHQQYSRQNNRELQDNNNTFSSKQQQNDFSSATNQQNEVPKRYSTMRNQQTFNSNNNFAGKNNNDKIEGQMKDLNMNSNNKENQTNYANNNNNFNYIKQTNQKVPIQQQQQQQQPPPQQQQYVNQTTYYDTNNWQMQQGGGGGGRAIVAGTQVQIHSHPPHAHHQQTTLTYTTNQAIPAHALQHQIAIASPTPTQQLAPQGLASPQLVQPQFYYLPAEYTNQYAAAAPTAQNTNQIFYAPPPPQNTAQAMIAQAHARQSKAIPIINPESVKVVERKN